MDIKQALQVANSAFFTKLGRRLSEVEAVILLGSLQGQTYEQIAETSGYAVSYLKKDVSHKFWKLLGQALGETVSKTNFRAALDNYWRESLIAATQTKVLPGEAGEAGEARERKKDTKTRRHSDTERSNYIDWGEATDVSVFFGCHTELKTLTQWITQDRCRLVAILGMGGIGKTAVVVKLAQQIQDQFESVIWRSLRNAPPLETLLTELAPFLSNRQDTQGTLTQFIHYLQTNRCLVILDNLETILQGGEYAGQFLSGYEGYSELLRIVGESNHQSCVILTSREKPAEVAVYEGENLQVRSLSVSGSQETALSLLQAKGLVGSEKQKELLCDRYGNNPLALKIVATSIQDLFDGDIGEFLRQDTFIFNGIRRLLDYQFERLSALEFSIMYWLAINREWTSISELGEDIISPISRAKLLEALESLSWRSLIERQSGSYTQQPVVMEYITECLIEKIVSELESQKLNLLFSHALMKTTVKDYVRESQAQLILKPITNQLSNTYITVSDLKQQIQQILLILQHSKPQLLGYAAGNLMNVCHHLNVDLTGYDFSNLIIRHAYLQNANLHQVSFIGSEFVKSVFTQTFGGIWAVTFSPDGKLLATGETNGKVRLWRAEDLQPVLVLEGHTSWVRCVDFSPDSSILVSSSDDSTIKLWEVTAGKLLQTLQGHTSWVLSIDVSPDGSLLVSSSDDQTVKLWDIQTGQLVRTLLGHHAPVRSVQFSPDGTLLASGGGDCNVKLWEVHTGQPLQTLKGHTKWVTSIHFAPVGNTLASGSEDCTIRLWDVSTGKPLQTLEGHTKWVTSIHFDPIGNTLASGSEDCTVRFWNPCTGELLYSMANICPIWCISFSPKSGILATGGEEHTLKVWDVSSKKLIKTLQGYNAQAWSVQFNPSGTMLAGGSTDRVIRLWDTRTGNLLKILRGYGGWVRCVSFNPDGNVLAGSSDDQTIKLWDLRTGQLMQTLQGHSLWVFAVRFNPQGNLLATGSGDRTIKLWNVDTAKCLASLEGHTGWIRSISFSPDGNLLASGSSDYTINIWNIHTKKLVNTLTNHTSQVWSVDWSPQSNILASGSSDHTIKLWDVRSGKLLQILQGHTAQVSSICFNSDGTLLASGSADQSLKVWNVQTGKLLQTLQGHTNWVLSVAFDPQGQFLASSSADETILLWDIQTWGCINTFRAERPYEGMNITNVRGLTEAQKATLKALGAIKDV